METTRSEVVQLEMCALAISEIETLDDLEALRPEWLELIGLAPFFVANIEDRRNLVLVGTGNTDAIEAIYPILDLRRDPRWNRIRNR